MGASTPGIPVSDGGRPQPQEPERWLIGGVLSNPDRGVAGGDRREARAIKVANRGREPQAMGVPRHEGDLVRATLVSAAALRGPGDRRDYPSAAEQRRATVCR